MYDDFEERRPKKENAGGAPAWMVTFADLMALLMCFFVLILSFSEMDVQKYKQVAGSMAAAFGVQREIVASQSPMGTSFVAREFTPGKPEHTPLKVITQKTSSIRPHLDFDQKVEKRIQATAQRVRNSLKDEIRTGLVDVETEGEKVIVRIREKASFPSGSAELMQPFQPVLAKIGAVLSKELGQIIVAGHTDDIPIRNGRFRSNWELASSRAVTVVHELMKADVPPNRMLIQGHADLQPLVPNTTPEHRAMNRRVEISLQQTPDQVLPTTRVIELSDHSVKP